jgi:glycerophosphoryl diester phosphodiesterase
MPASIQIIAHRGYSARAPENTLAALGAAVQAGADAVEFDLHVAACGTPVLFHDAMLGRTTNGVGPLRRRTFGQLKGLDAGAWFGPEFAGERIPSFTGLVYAEVKGFRELEDLDRMVEIAASRDMLREVVFISLNWIILDRFLAHDARPAIGYVVDGAEEVDEALGRARDEPRAMVDLRGDLILADPAITERAASQSTELAVWTVDDLADASRLRDLGIRRFTTNQVERLLHWRETS